MATSDLTRSGGVASSRRFLSGWWRHRDLLGELVRRDLQARYRGSNLGVLWSLLNPLVYMVIYSVIFSSVFRVKIPNVVYPVFLLSGLLAWNFFSSALVVSVNSVLGNSSIVKKVAFPWVLLTLSSVLAAFINYLISLVLLVPVLLLNHSPVGAPLVVVPFLVLVMFCLALGLSLFVAAANVYFRDMEYLLSIALQVGFFLTPIIYELGQVIALAQKSKHRVLAPIGLTLLKANPMAWIVSGFQDVLARNSWPLHWHGLVYAAVASLAVLALGLLVFERLQGRFAEEL